MTIKRYSYDPPPVFAKALLWDGTNHEDAIHLADNLAGLLIFQDNFVEIGSMVAYPGDWLVMKEGRLSVWKDDQFHKVFTEANNG